MRIAAGVLLLFVAACGSSGSFVDASQPGAPFSLAGCGFTRDPEFNQGYASTEEMVFLFENVSERPQTVESIAIRQLDELSSPVQLDAGSERVDRMIDPGEELEVKMLVRVRPRVYERGTPPGRGGLALDIILRHADGTNYRYPVRIPLKTVVGVRQP